MACKSGGHVCLGDGPELAPGLAARFGTRHDLHLDLRNFDVIFPVPIESLNHINIEVGVALLRYLRWVLRAASRFRHRLVLLVDSKIVLGAISKGRSSFKTWNTIARRAAALCFAGGFVLDCFFISTKHNLADWPSRGDRSTWFSVLRRRFRNELERSRCPGFGVLPKDHPRHFPERVPSTIVVLDQAADLLAILILVLGSHIISSERVNSRIVEACRARRGI